MHACTYIRKDYERSGFAWYACGMNVLRIFRPEIKEHCRV